MTVQESILVEGSLRKNLHRTPLQRLTQAWSTRALGHVGDGVYVERGAEFLRHPQRISLGRSSIIKAGVRLCPANAAARIDIGDNTSIGYHTHIFATAAITIGADCLIAPFCYIVDANHGTRRDDLIRQQPMVAAPIRVGDDVWLGASVTVLAGVTIGDGVVVAAGSVVARDLPPYVIAAGSPAVPVSERRVS